MFNLKSLSVRNFLSFQEADINLEKSGLYLISGFDEKSQGSNGSGKSTLLNAICFCLFGRTATGLSSLRDIKRWDTSKPMEVSLELINESKEIYKIVRNEEEVTFYMGGEKVEGHKRDVQTTINECFKTSYDLFLSATMLAAGQTEFIAAASDATKKKLFKPIFQLDIIDKLYMAAQADYKSLTEQANKLGYDIAARKSMLTEHLFHINLYKDKANRFEENRKIQVQELEAKKTTTKTNVDPLLTNRIEELKIRITSLNLQIEPQEACHLNLQKLESEKLFLKAMYEENISVLDESNGLIGTTCKYCGAEIQKKDLEKHKAELTRKIDEIIKQATEVDDKIQNLEKKILQSEKITHEIEKTQGELDQAQNILFQQEAIINSQNLIIGSIDKQILDIKNAPNTYTQDVSHYETKAKETQQSLIELEDKLKKTTKNIDLCGFLKWTFSKEGVIAFIIERAFGRLESLANRHLSQLSTEPFRVEIKPQHELKTKALKEEIDISVLSGDKKLNYWGASDGQRSRINLALLFAINKLCRDRSINLFNFLLLDEVLDLSLDSTGQENVVRLLRWLLQDVHSIMVISHREEISKDFDFNIQVHRNKEGISQIE